MGQDIRLKSKNIFNAYLSLGLLEIASETNPDKRVSQQNIFEKMPHELNINDVSDIRDYINSAKKWLKDADLTDAETDYLINTRAKGTRLLNNIPETCYKDFLAGFLLLNLIEDKNHIELINNTFKNSIEKPLSIITKIALAKIAVKTISIALVNPARIIDFIPNAFKFNSDEWLIIGSNITDHDHYYELKLSNISKIKYKYISPI
jgi:hypothetical protein